MSKHFHSQNKILFVHSHTHKRIHVQHNISLRVKTDYRGSDPIAGRDTTVQQCNVLASVPLFPEAFSFSSAQPEMLSEWEERL